MAIVISPAGTRALPGVAGDAAIAAAGALVLLAFHAAGGFATLADMAGDNDSMLRLVQVRDLLAGQGWFDPTQYRMGPEGGFAMHWSRLVDLPVALLVAGFGENAALVAWPAALFGLALFLILRAARALGGERAVLPAAVIGGLALYFVNLFAPGMLDHHNVQLVLALAALVFLLRARERAHTGVLAGALAGLCAASMLAVGMEAAPYAAVACAVAALSFLKGDEADAAAARGFGIAFAAVSLAALVATVPAGAWLAAHCDAFSFPQASLAVLGGGGLALAASLPSARHGSGARLAVLGGLAVLAAAFAFAAFPQCLADPYADLDPRLRRYWLSAVSEAQPALSVLRADPAMFASYYATPLVALAVTAWTMARRGMSRDTAIVAGFLATAFLVSLWQVRGAMFSVPLAVVPLAAWVGHVRHRAETAATARAQVAMAAAWLVSFNLAWQFAAGLPALAAARPPAGADAAASGGGCYVGADYAALAAMPAGTVLAISNQGSAILLNTPHRVLNGPYHRNNGGNLAALAMLMGDPAAARVAARRHGITYVALCRGNGETASIVKWAPDGLLARLAAGAVPSWLAPVPGEPDAAIGIFRVEP